jgi:membrane protein involved in colicin uptake
MPSKSDNFFTRIKENVMGTKEENAQAEKDIAKYKEAKAKEKAAEEAKKTKMAKGGMPAKKKATAAASKKKPALAIMIAVGKPKMRSGGMPTKKAK